MSDETKPKEVKVVIAFKGDSAAIGIQQTDCDPLFFQAKGTLGDVLAAIPGFMVEAGQKWGANPRYPKADLPAPEPAPQLAAAQTNRSTTAAAPSLQQHMF